jgi:hypothetical protein
MKKDRWLDTLEQFRNDERPECVLLVSGSPSLIRIVVAWMNMPIERRKRLTPFPQDAGQQWEWLWRNAVYSTERLATYMPSSDKELEQKLQALIANKVLHPDGTVNGYVERFLRARIVKTLSSAGHRLRKTS